MLISTDGELILIVSFKIYTYILQYLDGLFQKDPNMGGLYHQRQVELYATYDSEKLLPFLRSCTDIPLQKVCVCIVLTLLEY